MIGRWRMVEADIWDRGYLDLSGPAIMTIGADNHGEIAFGAMKATLQIGYNPPWSSSLGPGLTKWTRSWAHRS